MNHERANWLAQGRVEKKGIGRQKSYSCLGSPARGRESAFTLIELLVVIAIIAIIAAIVFPVFAQSRAANRLASCISNTKQIGLGIRMYTTDFDEVLPIASFSESYGDCHPVSKSAPSGPEGQKYLPDVLYPYVKNQSIWACPELKGAYVPRLSSGKYVKTGAYAYACGHAHDDMPPGNESNPLRVFLWKYGPRNGVENPGGFFACGNPLAIIEEPEDTVMAFQEHFGVHGEGKRMGEDWYAEFLPEDLGGNGNERTGTTTVVYGDGHAKSTNMKFRQFLQNIGIENRRQPLFAESTSRCPF